MPPPLLPPLPTPAPAHADLATLRIDGPVARLTINRPDARNALSADLIDALRLRLAELAAGLEHAPGVTVLVLSGAGTAFCAGMDLKQVLGNDAAARRVLFGLAAFTRELRRVPAVTLALVNGAAIGGGCGIVAVCDLAITFADAKMGFPEVDLGVCPAVVGPWLCGKIGFGAARRVLLSGGLMNGAEAHRLGIVSHVVPTREELGPAAETIVTRLAASAPHAVAATKKLLNEMDALHSEATLAQAAELSAQVLATPATQAMLRAKFS